MKQSASPELESEQAKQADSEQIAVPEPLGPVRAPEVPLTGGLAFSGEFPIQHKVVVGGVADPAEFEAEQVARSVVMALRGNPGAAATTAQRTAAPAIRRHAGHDHDEHRKKKPDIHRCGDDCEHTTVHRCTDSCQHGMGSGGGAGIVNRSADAHNAPGADTRNAPIGAQGGEVDSSTESILKARTGNGRAIGDGLRGKLETVMGADLSGIRLHADEQASQLNRSMSAVAFTHGRDIYFRDGLPNTATDAGLHLLAHELTHTVQQGTAPQVSRMPAAEHEYDPLHDEQIFTLATPISARVGDDDGIHRHAAFEHYLLGQLQPKEIAKIPSVRKVADKSEQKDNLEKTKEGKGTSGLADSAFDAKGDSKEEKEARADALHVIDQEMERLWKFKNDPESLEHEIKGDIWAEIGEAKKGKTKDRKGIESQDETYQVPIVVLMVRGDEDELDDKGKPVIDAVTGKPKPTVAHVIVSYSEMNTMPDLFGNPEAIKATPKKHVLALLQGVRQQLYIELSNIRKELTGKANNKLSHWYGDDDFKDATGPRAQAVIDSVYEIRTESQVDDATKRKGEEHEQYFAALERNACHFAPESWRQWRAYHEKALELAKKAANAKERVKLMREANAANQGLKNSDKTIKDAEIQAKMLSNEAMIQNSFGEHYLQDSFASGHLIDKTQVMQWFTLWADKDKGGMGTSSSEQAQWAMAVHAAGHKLKSNPQMLHDKGARGEFKGANDAANEVGLGVQKPDGKSQDDEIVFMMKWRAKAKAKREYQELTLDEAAKTFGISRDDADEYMQRLMTKRFVRFIEADFDMYFEDVYQLDTEMINVINSDAPGASKGLNPFQKRKVAGTAYAATRGKVDKKGSGNIDDNEAKAAAAEFNLAGYNAMLSNSFVGAATKYFHDKFCKEGLIVKSGGGTDLGRIYGDANMLNAGGQKGVEWSAETSKWSREAIFNTMNGLPEGHSTDDIANRFPATVVYGKKDIRVENFSKEIEEALEQDMADRDRWYKPMVLNPASSNKGRAAYKMMGGISDQGALNVAQLGHKGKDPF
jgi:hypothetical protein